MNNNLRKLRISLWEIYNQIIDESLEFNSNDIYKTVPNFEGCEFDANLNGETVKVFVYVEQANIDRFLLSQKFQNKNIDVANFGFEVGELERNNAQYKKSNYKDYIKIIRTVGHALQKFITANKPDIVTFFSQSKHGGNEADIQKDRIYLAALERNRFNGYELDDVIEKTTNKHGVMLYKTSLIEQRKRLNKSKVKLFINESDIENRLINLKKNILYMAPNVNIDVKHGSDSKLITITGTDMYLNRLFEYFNKSDEIKTKLNENLSLTLKFPNELFK